MRKIIQITAIVALISATNGYALPNWQEIKAWFNPKLGQQYRELEPKGHFLVKEPGTTALPHIYQAWPHKKAFELPENLESEQLYEMKKIGTPLLGETAGIKESTLPMREVTGRVAQKLILPETRINPVKGRKYYVVKRGSYAPYISVYMIDKEPTIFSKKTEAAFARTQSTE